jgi:preprotein translocase subunit SecD
MSRSTCLLATILLLGNYVAVRPQDKTAAVPKKLPDGLYLVERDSLKEKEVLPLKANEVLVVNHHRYVKKEDNQPRRFVVVRSAPDVSLDLAAEPKAVKEGSEVVRILLKLQPKAAMALERLTRAHLGRQIAIILSGEVVTMHKVRGVIKGGDVQITSCAAGAAGYLLEQLQSHHKNK